VTDGLIGLPSREMSTTLGSHCMGRSTGRKVDENKVVIGVPDGLNGIAVAGVPKSFSALIAVSSRTDQSIFLLCSCA
jgi:hypothetical protein